MILMDTSYLILLARGSPKAENLIDLIDNEGGVLTTISYFEIFRSGNKMSKKEQRYFTRLFSTYPVLSLDVRAAHKASELWYKLERLGRITNVLDVLIGGIMIANGIDKIVTSDKDFLEIGKISEIEVILI